MKAARLAVSLILVMLGSLLLVTSKIEFIEAPPVTLRVIGPWLGVEQDDFLLVLGAFENQTGINVEYNQTYAGDLAQSLPGEFEEGRTPGDLIFAWPWFIQEMGAQGHLFDVAYLTNESDFLPGVLDVIRVEDRRYGGSYTGKAKPGFWYRESFFSANGLAEPTDWNGFLTLLDDIAAVEGVTNPIASGDEVGWPLSDVTEHFLITFGGPQLHRNLTSGKSAWNSSGVRNIFSERLIPLLQGNFSEPIEWLSAMDLWWQGNYGLYFSGSWIISMVDNATDLGLFSLPGAEGLVLAPDYFFVPVYSEHPDQALDLFRFLASADGQEIQVAQGGHVATNVNVPLNTYPQADRMVVEILDGKEMLPDLDDTVGGRGGSDFQITFWEQMKRLWTDPTSLDDVLDILEAAFPRPVTWTVDNDGPADFSTIQEAINRAYPGDIVLVLPGTYYENVVVNKSVSLIGENLTNTIVNGLDQASIAVTEDNVNITGFTIRNNVSGIGVSVSFSSSVRIYGNNISSSQYGAYAYQSSNISIFGNVIMDNEYGIAFGICTNSTILENHIAGNTLAGILLSNSTGISVHGNGIADNYHGVYLGDSLGNLFDHNNFVGNTWAHVTIVTPNSSNFWDTGYPSGGNFWGDYNGTDLYKGPYQNETGSDGIGDTPYIIDGVNRDRYPLSGPFGPYTSVGEDVIVFPSDDVGLIFKNITSEGITSAEKFDEGPEPPLGLSVVQYYSIVTTARYTGNITIRIIYDDSNLTQIDEESLQLMQYVTIEGDVDWDFDVDIFDIVRIAGVYGSEEGDSEFLPECDIDRDGDVDIFDVVRAAGNYGHSLEPDQRWINVTKWIDIENNLIMGEAIHLSIFGVTRS